MTKNKPKPFLCYKIREGTKMKTVAKKIKTSTDFAVPPNALFPAKVMAVNCIAAAVIYRNTILAEFVK